MVMGFVPYHGGTIGIRTIIHQTHGSLGLKATRAVSKGGGVKLA
jgi:hypothetical protein